MKLRILAAALVLIALSGGIAYAAHVLTLDAGDSVAIQCTADALSITQDNPVSALAICSANATATAVPTDTPAPEPTATPTHDHHMDEADLRWHAPGTHGDRPVHEHGDAPPQWVLDAGYDPQFTHVAGTPGENHVYWKHTSFKGYAGTIKGQDFYCINHQDFSPAGHVSRFHSYQCWFRDPTGAVSHFHGWLDFGEGEQTGPNLVVVCGQASNIRPIIMANQQGCNPLYETWYPAPAMGGNRAQWAPDFGFSNSPNYFAGGDPANPATWVSVNPWASNLTRRIEIAWYADRSPLRGEFWTTQFGDSVSGPADPVCGTQRSYGERSYPVVCIKQVIQPTLQDIRFPNNAIQKTFPDPGVELPN